MSVHNHWSDAPTTPDAEADTVYSPQEEQRAELRAEQREVVRHDYGVARANQIIYLILGIVESLLIIRFVLKLLAANPDAAFTNAIYGLTDPMVTPFNGVFSTPQTHNVVLDLAAVLAMIVYALVGWGIAKLIYALGARRPVQPV